jgi:hypothetical protein
MSSNDTLVNGRSPVTKVSNGTTTKFPDVCKTPVGNAIVPIPYPNVSKSGDLAKGSKSVKINGATTCLSSSEIATSTGDEAGSAKGIASGTTKGKAFPMNYSFDVKIEGKNVVRNADPFIGNNRNTPPIPIMQAQLTYTPMQEEKEKCPYCGKTEHPFAEKWGTNAGISQTLRKNIIAKIEDHAWYTGPSSLEAHHLVCSEAMDDDDWSDYCTKFGYDINHKNNGVMLPNLMALACQLYVALHRSNHKAGMADGVPYPVKIQTDLEEIANEIRSGKFCDNPRSLIDTLDRYSQRILKKIDTFRWTITADGKDYQAGHCGCAGVTSITKKPKQSCPHDRSHSLARKGQTTAIPRRTQPLEIGK